MSDPNVLHQRQESGKGSVDAELARISRVMRNLCADLSRGEDPATAGLMAMFELDGVEVER